MNAAQIDSYGNPDVIEVTETDLPEILDDMVLIKVSAASLNPFDTMVREGYVKDAIKSLPITLGGDVAGTVVQVGSNVSTLKVGDDVYGQANAVAGNSGSFAEFAATKATQLALAPRAVTVLEASTLPLVGASAIQALDTLQISPQQKILITGGAGGIGRIAIQIAKHLGAYVATTVKSADVDYVKSLGADEVIDYASENAASRLHDYDAIFDTVGGDQLVSLLPILRTGGRVVSMAIDLDEPTISEHNIEFSHQMTHVTTEALDTLRELVDMGVVTPLVGKIFPLLDIRAAFRARESGDVRGKIVVQV